MTGIFANSEFKHESGMGKKVVFLILLFVCCFSCTAHCRVTGFCTRNPDLWITKDRMLTPSLQLWCHQLAVFNFLLRQKLSLGWSAGATPPPPTPSPTLWVQGSVLLDSSVWWIKLCSDGGEKNAFVYDGDGWRWEQTEPLELCNLCKSLGHMFYYTCWCFHLCHCEK